MTSTETISCRHVHCEHRSFLRIEGTMKLMQIAHSERVHQKHEWQDRSDDLQATSVDLSSPVARSSRCDSRSGNSSITIQLVIIISMQQPRGRLWKKGSDSRSSGCSNYTIAQSCAIRFFFAPLLVSSTQVISGRPIENGVECMGCAGGTLATTCSSATGHSSYFSKPLQPPEVDGQLEKHELFIA
jgi:hypothetical protein